MPLENRRRHPRIYSPVEVNYHYGNELFSEFTVSLSMGGLYIKTFRPLETGSIFLLDFTLPDFTHCFRIRGKVIWKKFVEDKNGPPGMGIKFMDAREEDKKALLQYLAYTQVTLKGY